MCTKSALQLLKLEWFSMDRDLRLAKNTDQEGVVSEAEIEDAAQLQEPPKQEAPPDDLDDMMVDVLEHEEEAEIDALISSMPTEPSSSNALRPDSPQWSDDEDYDALFMDFISQDDTQEIVSSGQMDMS